MENRVLSKAEWLSKAEAYCARSEHCAADVRRKLYEWGAPSDLFDEIEESLRRNDFLNDARFCAAYVHDKVAFQSWGRIKIQACLAALGLPEAEIRRAIDDLDEPAYRANLRALAKARRADAPEKRMRFLLQRGFTYSEIEHLCS